MVPFHIAVACSPVQINTAHSHSRQVPSVKRLKGPFVFWSSGPHTVSTGLPGHGESQSKLLGPNSLAYCKLVAARHSWKFCRPKKV